MPPNDWPIGHHREYCWVNTWACATPKLDDGWKPVYTDPRYGSILMEREVATERQPPTQSNT